MNKQWFLILFAIIIPGLRSSAAAPPDDIYIQRVIDQMTAGHADLISIGVHAKPPGETEYFIVAHTKRSAVGHRSDEHEDRAAIVDGKTGGPNALPGGIYDITLPLADASGRRVGAVAIHVKPDPGSGDPTKAALTLARRYRDELSGHIPSEMRMFEKER